MKLAKWVALFLLILTFIASLAVVIYLAIHGYHGAYADSAQKEQSYGADSNVNEFWFFLSSLAIFLRDFGGAVAAWATLVISYLTWMLAYSTDKLWGATRDSADAAKASADALQEIERGWLIPKKISGTPSGNVISSNVTWAPYINFPWKNVGRSACTTLDEGCRLFLIGKIDDLPEVPDYRKREVHVPRLLYPEAKIRKMVYADNLFQNGLIDWNRIQSGEIAAVLIGFMKYQTVGTDHETRFFYVFKPYAVPHSGSLGYWILGNKEGYTLQT